MFLKKISFRITLWYLILLVLSSCVLFIVFYYLYSDTLSQSDHELLDAKFQEYTALYNIKGTQSIEDHFKIADQEQEDATFFIRVASANNKTIYFRTPVPTKNFDLSEIENNLQNLKNGKEWFYLKTKNHAHDVEVLSFKMPNGLFFQIGKTVADRDQLLENYIKIFMEVVLFAIILGGIGGVLLSNRLLSPLRNLISTIKTIRTGDESARVPLVHSTDEFEELTILFNLMLDHVQTSNQSMRQTLDTIAHELRTPLTSVRGLAEVTLRKNNFNETESRRVLEDCILGIDEILTEFKMMTDITIVESGIQNLNKEDLDLNEICNDIVNLYEIVADQKEIKIILNTDSNIRIYADKKKLRQVVANLLDNAIKYSPENSEIKIITSQDSENAFIKICDQGIGISENDMPHIWKRLYRGENGRHEKGMGLGLSLVKSIILAHQGEIIVENNGGPGSIFLVRLPIR
jgi:signal transduction histidine kinase